MQARSIHNFINTHQHNLTYLRVIKRFSTYLSQIENVDDKTLSADEASGVISIIYQEGWENGDLLNFLKAFKSLFEKYAAKYSDFLLNPTYGIECKENVDLIKITKKNISYYIKKTNEDAQVGGQGSVSKVYDDLTLANYSLAKKKLIRKENEIIPLLKKAQREVANLALLNREATFCIDPFLNVYIIYCWLHGDSLAEFSENQLIALSIKLRLNGLRPFINEIKQLHEKGYVHNDIKLGNIILNKSTQEMHLIDLGSVSKQGSKKSYPHTLSYYLYSQYSSRENQFANDIYAFALVIAYLFPERLTYQENIKSKNSYFLKAINYFLEDCIDINNWKDWDKTAHYNERYNIQLISDFFQSLAAEYDTLTRHSLNKLIEQYQLKPEHYFLKRLRLNRFLEEEINAILNNEVIAKQITELSLKDQGHLQVIARTLAHLQFLTIENIQLAITRITWRLPKVQPSEIISISDNPTQIKISPEQLVLEYESLPPTNKSVYVGVMGYAYNYKYSGMAKGWDESKKEYIFDIKVNHVVNLGCDAMMPPYHIQYQQQLAHAMRKIKYARSLNQYQAIYYSYQSNIYIVKPKRVSQLLDKVNCQYYPLKKRLACLVNFLAEMQILHRHSLCQADNKTNKIWIDFDKETMHFANLNHHYRFFSNNKKIKAPSRGFMDSYHDVLFLVKILSLLFPECGIKNKKKKQIMKNIKKYVSFNDFIKTNNSKNVSRISGSFKPPSLFEYDFDENNANYLDPFEYDSNENHTNNLNPIAVDTFKPTGLSETLFSDAIMQFKTKSKQYKPMGITIISKELDMMQHAISLLKNIIDPRDRNVCPLTSHRAYTYCVALLNDYEKLSTEKIDQLNRDILLAPVQLEDVLEMPYTIARRLDKL